LKNMRQRYQQGSLRKIVRKSGIEVWEYRYRSKAEPGSPMRQLTLSITQYPTETKARVALQEQLLRLNGAEAYRARVEPTFGVVIDRFVKEERLAEILAQRPGEVKIDGLAYSTAAGYTSYINRHIRPRWQRTPLSEMRPIDVAQWIHTLPLAPKTKAHIKRVLHLLFERAMLWGLIDVQRNPLGLVKVKGGSKRLKALVTLTSEEFQSLLRELHEPFRTMATVAMCTGLRISEVLALRWDNFDFKAGTMLVHRGVVNGRIGRTKTETSKDEVPLDGDLAAILLSWRESKQSQSSGLVFPSPLTGGCYYAGMIQKLHLKPAGERIGIKGLGWHAFRHSYRGLLDETGANAGMQKGLMRHANISTTMNTYGRAAIKAKQEANSKVVQMILPNENRALSA
jgi:integrase